MLIKGTTPVVNWAVAAEHHSGGAYIWERKYRRLRTQLGALTAITAHKLARLVYRMLKYGKEYIDTQG